MVMPLRVVEKTALAPDTSRLMVIHPDTGWKSLSWIVTVLIANNGTGPAPWRDLVREE